MRAQEGDSKSTGVPAASTRGLIMDVVYRRCCGIDMHKCSVAAWLSIWEEDGTIRKDKRVFGTITGELRRLAKWLGHHAVTQVAMEATGVYWEPVWNVLDKDGS
jgi:hypothetical protein